MTTINTMAGQHASRPADEVHWDWQSAEARARREEETSASWDVVLAPDNLTASDVDVSLDGVVLGYSGFGRVCAEAGAPQGYLTTIPAHVAVQALQYGLARGGMPRKRVAYAIDGQCLALTSERYSREGSVSNLGLVRLLRDMANEHGLTAAEHFRTATELGTGQSHPLGFLGHGSMAFCLVDYSRPVRFNGRTLSRGIIVENNTLGAGAARMTMFLFDHVCANFLIWGAEILSEQRVTHIGNASDRYRLILEGAGAALALPAETTLETLRGSARLLGDTRDDVQRAVYSLREPLLGKKLVGLAYDRAEASQGYGDPRSAWAIVGGLTELSQELCTHAADRLALDRAAGRLLTANS